MRDNPRLDEHPGVLPPLSFGVKVEVAGAIRNVLKKYSKCSVVKELLQNADDAVVSNIISTGSDGCVRIYYNIEAINSTNFRAGRRYIDV
jgi:hypothetical protein